MIRRCFALFLLAVSVLLSLPMTARADFLIEPRNDFYTRHRDECSGHSEAYYARGKGGSVSAKKEPGAQEEVFAVKNGNMLYVSYTYEYNGGLWGLAEDAENYDHLPSGWVPMNQLVSAEDSSYSIDSFIFTVLIIVILVVILLAGTGVLIRIFWKPGKGRIDIPPSGKE